MAVVKTWFTKWTLNLCAVTYYVWVYNTIKLITVKA